MQDKKDSFVFYRSFYEGIETMEDKEIKCDIYEAICNYCLNGVEPETDGWAKAYLLAIKPMIDNASARYNARVENGKKGGAPKGNQNAKKQPKNNQETTKNNLYEYVYDYDYVNKKNINSATELHETDNHDVDDLAIDEYNFGIIWAEYPRKEGKTNAFKYYRKYVRQGKKINGKNIKLTDNQIYNAVVKYANSVKGKEAQYIQMGSTFFNTTIIDYVDEEQDV